MNDFSTPMMRQYKSIKIQYPDCLLFYRMGDFYELFNEDAHVGAQVLNITLTSKAGGKDGKIPMAGVPYHALDSYLTKLIKAGYKVAICEQLSPPNKKGLVERDVVRVVTPGTLMDENSLEKKENNFVISLVVHEGYFSLAAADLSTGFFTTMENEFEDLEKALLDELARIKPSECILSDDLYNNSELLHIIKKEKDINIFPFSNADIYKEDAKNSLKQHFKIKTLESFGLEDSDLSQQSAAILLGYLKETQKGNISHVKKISPYSPDKNLLLDRSSIINLELFSTIRDHDTRGSLLSHMDMTLTAMGGRLLKNWMKKPLSEKKSIEMRYESVEELLEKSELRYLLQENLRQIPDLERLLSRLSVHLGNSRDLQNLKAALIATLQAKKILESSNSELLQVSAKNISIKIEKLIHFIDQMIVEDPPISLREGGMIKNGVNKELDALKNKIVGSKEWIKNLEITEREKTGINTLKVKFNKVFGFYIEVSKANAHLVPSTYFRKQTLVNGERFITKELKEHEEIVLSAEEIIHDIEYRLFFEILEDVLRYTTHIQQAAESIATVDCIIGFAEISEKNHYVRPKLLYSGEIKIKEGRHPVVEQLLKSEAFVPNDSVLDNISQSLLLITGPNMAGKSVYIRQVALIVLMAHMGCFVPAKSAHISLCDRIFVRSGASDVITSGLSTFMVEMVETAYILNNASKNSLIVMDEIGRGTSTYDGISIAWAVAEYLVTGFKPSPKVLFATHYHELQSLEEKHKGLIKNFHMGVTEQKGAPIFLHTLLSGGASHSFGVAVARLAGVPQEVIDKAYEILQTLEYRDVTENGKEYFEKSSESDQRNDNNIAEHLIHNEIANIDVATITPLEALNILADLKEKIRILNESSTSRHTVD